MVTQSLTAESKLSANPRMPTRLNCLLAVGIQLFFIPNWDSVTRDPVIGILSLGIRLLGF
jgi:hypothetical protein